MSQLPKTILLADDDLDDQQLLEEALLHVEPTAEIHTVSSGLEVFDYLQNCCEENLPCLIILDYNMPHLSGAEVLEKLCQLKRFLSVPKIIWSTSDAPQYREICKDNGAAAYFHKPPSFEGMIILAERMLGICNDKLAAG